MVVVLDREKGCDEETGLEGEVDEQRPVRPKKRQGLYGPCLGVPEPTGNDGELICAKGGEWRMEKVQGGTRGR